MSGAMAACHLSGRERLVELSFKLEPGDGSDRVAVEEMADGVSMPCGRDPLRPGKSVKVTPTNIRQIRELARQAELKDRLA
jgi:hypothetical protein